MPLARAGVDTVSLAFPALRRNVPPFEPGGLLAATGRGLA